MQTLSQLASVASSQLAEQAQTFEALADEYLKQVQSAIDAERKMPWGIPQASFMKGDKRWRIVVKDRPEDKGGSAFGFIDFVTGDLLKAASYAAPAKGARGNLFDKNTWKDSFTAYGMAYKAKKVYINLGPDSLAKLNDVSVRNFS